MLTKRLYSQNKAIINMMNPIAFRTFHQINRSGVQATQNETPVMVYNSSDFEDFSKSHELSDGIKSNWDNSVMRSQNRSKFFSLLPFFIESKFASKSFVLRMELFPEAKYLRFHTLKMHGV